MTVSTRTWRAAALAVLTLLSFGDTASALDAQQQAIDPALLNAYRWRSIGPDRGGRSIAVAGVKGRPREAYFGAVGGGLWKTTDAGNNWAPVTDGQITQLVGRRGRGLGIEPRRRLHRHGRDLHPRQHHARRRRLQIRPTPARRGRTSASGTSTRSRRFASTPPTPTSSTWRRSASITARATSAASSRRPTAARPGSARCSRTRAPAPSTSSSTPTTPTCSTPRLWEAYRIEYQMSSGGPGSGMYKSTDGGETWTEITRNAGLPPGVVGRIGLANTKADSNRVYALVENENGGLFVSDDAGASWKLINTQPRHPPARVLLHARLRRPEQQGRRLHAEHGAVPLHRRRQDDGAGRPEHARRSPRSVGRSRRSESRDRRQRRRRRDHLRHHVARAELERAGLPHRAVVSRDHDGAPAVSTSAARSRTTARCACRATPTRGGGGFGGNPPVAPYQVGGGEPGYIATHATDPDIFFGGTNNGSFLTRLNRRTGEFKEVGAYPRFFSGEPATRRQGTLAVDLPDHLFVRRSERPLHELAARLEDDQRRRHVDARSAAT